MYYKTCKETKEYLLKLFKKCIEDATSIIKFKKELDKAIQHEGKYSNLLSEWKYIADNYLNENLLENEIGFKPACYVGNNTTKQYFYYMSNLGRMLVVDTNQIKNYHNDKQKSIITFKSSDMDNSCLRIGKNCWFVSIVNGKLGKLINCKIENLNISTETQIYKHYALYSDWINKNSKNLSQEWKEINNDNCNIEIHHINQNPNDNRDDNIIYLPATIHNSLCENHNVERYDIYC